MHHQNHPSVSSNFSKLWVSNSPLISGLKAACCDKKFPAYTSKQCMCFCVEVEESTHLLLRFVSVQYHTEVCWWHLQFQDKTLPLQEILGHCIAFQNRQQLHLARRAAYDPLLAGAEGRTKLEDRAQPVDPVPSSAAIMPLAASSTFPRRRLVWESCWVE